MLTTVFRTCLLYIVVIIAIRFMGKRQIGDMQPSELVITILISEIAAIPIQDKEIPLYIGIAATITLVILEMLSSYLAMKSIKLRKWLYGSSAIIIKDGVIDQKVLRKQRVTAPDLLEVLRNQQVFDITQVAYAILETNGQLSVLLKPDYQTVTFNTYDGEKPSGTMPTLVISDGKLLDNAIRRQKLSKEEIIKELNKRNLKIKDVFIMTTDDDKSINIIKKQ